MTTGNTSDRDHVQESKTQGYLAREAQSQILTILPEAAGVAPSKIATRSTAQNLYYIQHFAFRGPGETACYQHVSDVRPRWGISVVSFPQRDLDMGGSPDNEYLVNSTGC